MIATPIDSDSLRQLLGCLKAQAHQAWLLHLVVPSAAGEALRGLVQHACDEEPRVTVTSDPHQPIETIIADDYVVMIQDGCLPTEDALASIASFLATRPDCDWLFTDEEEFGADGIAEPVLKGAFSPELALTDDSCTRLATARTSVLHGLSVVEAIRPECQLDRLIRRTEQGSIVVEHLPAVCAHRRSVDSTGAEPLLATINAALQRRHLSASAAVRHEHGGAVLSVRWHRAVQPRVTILIPTRDRPDLIRRCVGALSRTVDPALAEVLILDDESRDPQSRDYLTRVGADCALTCRVFRVPRASDQFNYAALMNEGSTRVHTPFVLHLNDDVEADTAGWLEQLTGWLSIAEVGAVGAKLLRRDGTIQHAGIILRARGGLPLHLFDGLTDDDLGYRQMPHRTRNVSAVTGACLLTRTALFAQQGGFNSDEFAVQYNDVDYCLRLRHAGYRIVYEPGAVLRHEGGSSRGATYSSRENRLFVTRYGSLRDPYWSPHLLPRSLAGPTPVLIEP